MRKATALFCLLFLLTLAATYGASGSSSLVDPLVSLSYITGTYFPEIRARTDQKVEAALTPVGDAALQRLDGLFAQKTGDLAAAGIAASIRGRVFDKLVSSGVAASFAGLFTEVTLQLGDMVIGNTGTGFILCRGAGQIYGPASGEAVNLTAGGVLKSGQNMAANVYYLVPANDGTGVTAMSDGAVFSVSGQYTVKKAYTARYTALAEGLRSLGLFLGTPSGFGLERPATRMEALVMLIRLMGEEQAALACTEPNPFKDVDAWADRYAAYGFAMGYTKGVSADRFDPQTAVTMDQYVTFVLRALSYDDAAGDFSWDSASSFAPSAGLMTEQERQAFASGRFLRDHVVYVSRNALFTRVKESDATLADLLIANGAISSADFDEAQQKLRY